MKYLQLILFLLSITSLTAFAQPSNDECDGLIDLGLAPNCTTSTIYSNIDANSSTAGLPPSCFVSGSTQRDVWFAFTTTEAIETYYITVQGSPDGANNQAMRNPQIGVYRGNCGSLSEIGCASAENGAGEVTFSISNLPAGQRFILRVNDYTASATPNAGDFTICIEERTSFIMGESDFTDACRGTLFDSGGPEEDYDNREDLTYTICPNEFHRCILLEFEYFDLERNLDVLTIYEGDDRTAPILARVNGSSSQFNFPLQANSDCVTLHFQSDGSTRQAGFEMTWQCEASLCIPTSEERVTEIPSLPYADQLSTCGVAGSFAESDCGSPLFLNGPEHILRYNAPANACVSVEIAGAAAETGVMILDGLPSDPNTNCLVSKTSGVIERVELVEAGDYYIVVANPYGCTNFTILVNEANCAIDASLLNALCNPLNGCIEMGGAPSTFVFEDGFQDINLAEGINSGCWRTVGVQADFFWFSIQAQADGDFGFILESADEPSDIDFNVWGPFTPDNACTDRQDIVRFIESNQPIRSSWAATPGPTGVTNTHPIFQTNVNDAFDCLLRIPGATGDDFARIIDAQEGEVYVVLINDFGNEIENNVINVDWSPSDPEVLAVVSSEIITRDTSVCSGESVQLQLETTIDNISWTPTESLSCSNCPNPIATPTETTTYKAVVDGVCFNDTISIEVQVFGLDLPESLSVCLEETIELDAGSQFEGATYEWNASPALTLSCTDCPNPVVTATAGGDYSVSVSLITTNCTFFDRIDIQVLPQTAPDFEIIENTQLCRGESINLGNANNDPNQQYFWTSVPAGFVSDELNPTATPDVTTTYYVSVSNGSCPLASMDSVLVEIVSPPVVSVVSDTAICQGEILQLSLDEPEEDVSYTWSGPENIEDNTDLNTIFEPQRTGTYTLEATRGICTETVSVNVDVTRIKVQFVDEGQQPIDTVLMCLGDTITLDLLSITPEGVLPEWSPNDGLSDTLGVSQLANPSNSTLYYAQAMNGECLSIDSVWVLVDSLPADLTIMPADTMVCVGSTVVLLTETYEPGFYPNIMHEWSPSEGQETGDSLLNMVLSLSNPDTIIYQRMTENGACISIDTARVIVNPLPDIRIVGTPDTICPGEIATLNVELLNPEEVTIESYMWTPEDQVSSPTTQMTTVSAGGSYNVQVQSDKMCPGGASYFVQEYSQAILGLPDNPSICLGETIALNSIFGVDGATYTWESTDPNFDQFNIANPMVAPTSTTSYTVTAQIADCQPITESVTVEVIETISLSLTPTEAEVCLGNAVTLTASASLAGSFVWGTGQSDVGESSTISITPSSSLDISVVYANENCGVLEATASIEVNPLPNVRILAMPDSICIDDTVELSVELLNPEEVSISSYLWGPAEHVDATEGATTNAQTPNINYTVEVQTEDMCIGTADFTVASKDIILELTEEYEICSGGSQQLEIEDIRGDLTYSWTSSDPNFDQFDVLEPTVSPSSTATYTITAQATDCPPITRTVTVSVIEPQSFTLVPMEAEICPGDSIDLTATARGGVGTFIWDKGTEIETVRDVASSTINVKPTEPIDVMVSYFYGGVNGDLCEVPTEFVTLDVLGAIQIDSTKAEFLDGTAIGDSIIYQGDTIILSVVLEEVVADESIRWELDGVSLGTGMRLETQVNASTSPATYTVIITSEDGCESIGNVTINVRAPEVQMPNVFTPKATNLGRDINSYFRPFSAGNIVLELVSVHDRWGEKVYEMASSDTVECNGIEEAPVFSSSYECWAWNGNRDNDAEGRPAPTDVYIYTVIYHILGQEESETITGEILLLR